MGRLFICYLEGRVYSCKSCKAHLAKVDELVSKASSFSLFACNDATALDAGLLALRTLLSIFTRYVLVDNF